LNQELSYLADEALRQIHWINDNPIWIGRVKEVNITFIPFIADQETANSLFA
jgi:hypothetical protein